MLIRLSIKSAAIRIMSNLSKDGQILIDMMNYYNKNSLIELTKEEVLQYLHDRLNIL